MRYTNGFLRKGKSGKYVAVLKYKDGAGRWRQRTRTLTRDRDESRELFALWRAELTGERSHPAVPNAAVLSSSLPAAALPSASVTPAAGAAFPETPLATAAFSASVPVFATPLTVEQAVRATLSAQLARGRIERSTHDMQIAFAERLLFPALGATPIWALTAASVQRWVDRLCLQVSPGSARLTLSVLHKACTWASTQGQLDRNPLERVEPPSRARPQRAYLPQGSVDTLEQALDQQRGPGDWLSCAARLALYAGLRAGEACALRWRDVDLAAGRLRVSASVGRSEHGPYLKGPKCEASAREFPLVSALVRSLKTRQAQVGSDPAHFVCGEEGRFADPHSLSCSFARLCSRAGVTDNNGRRATFHVLRHTFATRAVQAGVDVRTLADLMGHARADVTLNVYAASSDDAKLAAAARLERAFPGA